MRKQKTHWSGGRMTAALALWLAVVVGPRLWASEEAKAGAVPIGIVRVMQTRLPVPIENAGRTFVVGDRGRLFQENEEFIVFLAERFQDTGQLMAVPLRRGGRKVAWATPEYRMFFGSEVASVEGRLYLRQGEELSVLREDELRYEALIERFGRRATLWIAKEYPGIRFIPNPVLSEQAADVKDSVRAEQEAVVQPLPVRRPVRAIPPRRETPEPAEKKVEHLFPDMDEKLISFMLPSVPGLDWDTAEPDPLPEPLMAERLEFFLEDMLDSLRQRVRLVSVALLLFVLMIALIVSGLRRAVLKHAHPPSLKKLAVYDEVAVKAASEPAQEADEPVGHGADFSGSVASMSLSAVTQFLNSDRETGVLTITGDDHERVGMMVFSEGEIIDAETPKRSGIPAVYELLKCSKGLFGFVRQPQVDARRTVEQGTISLLLEAHRELDEHKEEAAAAKTPPHAGKPAKKEKSAAAGLRVKRRAAH